MKERKNTDNLITRRGFMGSGAVALGAISMAPSSLLAATTAPATAVAKPNSVFNGVKIGATTFSFRGVRGNEGFLDASLRAGLSEIELRDPDLSLDGSSSTGGMGGGRRGAGGGQRGTRGGAQMTQRPSRRERLAAIEDLERQVTTLKTQIEKAPSFDPEIANLSGSDLTAFMDVYTPESNTINEMAKTLATLSGVDIPSGGIGGVMMGGMMGGGGGLTEDTLSELLDLAKQDNATKLTARIEAISEQVTAAAASRRSFGGMGGRGTQATPVVELTEEEKQTLRATRYLQLAKALDIRRMFNEAGVNIHCHKLSFGPTEEDIDFNFQVAKALGCVGITIERSEADAERLAPYADKHKIFVAFHNHTNNYPQLEPDDPILDYGNYIGFNFDTGHYVAGTGLSPIPVIEKYHDRIVTLHLKDRTAEGGNLPFGQGTTPICEMLQLLAKAKWPIYADIELEYQIPQGSDMVQEVKKCVEYCRDCLV